MARVFRIVFEARRRSALECRQSFREMKMKRLLVVVTALVVVGCAASGGQKWVKSETVLTQAEQDAQQCKYEAEKAAAAIINPWDKAFTRGDIERQCMRAKGYTTKK